ncbi:hypothetical protein FHS18_004090 [Paenibacillus phyllosphaerae]|uniref:Uncharacterized protein n=1 Tax=Paenibacillus phyllosphaerae TaxID=274593 RepID=A0A7W5B080_9BACL|nr:hypothetical protein [Paenibacillus phyllosphaerae]
MSILRWSEETWPSFMIHGETCANQENGYQAVKPASEGEQINDVRLSVGTAGKEAGAYAGRIIMD